MTILSVTKFPSKNEIHPEWKYIHDKEGSDILNILEHNFPGWRVGIESHADRSFNWVYITKSQERFSVDGFPVFFILQVDKGYYHLITRKNFNQVAELEEMITTDSLADIIDLIGLSS